MADPITLGIIAGGTMAAGSLIDSGNQIEDIRNQQAAADFNARALQQQAQEARRQSGYRQEAQQRAARKMLSTQRAALLQSGMGLTGSAGMSLEQGTILAELDKLALAYEGDIQARGFLQQSAAERFKKRVLADQKDTVRAQVPFNMATSALQGYSTAYVAGYRPGGY